VTMFGAMPDLDLGPKSYRWTNGPRHWRRLAKARKVRDGTLAEQWWFRVSGVVSGLWMGSVIGVARYVIEPAPLWPTLFISSTPALIWLLVLVWDDTA
jgi:sterol desaturase/sphingolipid hydroxylase (fatty acid hydroxylase superfamily)